MVFAIRRAPFAIGYSPFAKRNASPLPITWRAVGRRRLRRISRRVGGRRITRPGVTGLPVIGLTLIGPGIGRLRVAGLVIIGLAISRLTIGGGWRAAIAGR